MPVAIRVIIVSSPCRSERAADDTKGHPPHQTTIEVRTKPRGPGDSPKGGPSSRPKSDVPSGEYMMIGTVRIADAVLRLRGNRGNHELCSALLHVLGATEEGVPSVQVERTLQHDAAGERPGPNLVVRAVDQGARPGPPSADRLRGQRSRSDSVERLIGVEPFGTLQVGVPGRQAPTRPRIDGQPSAVGIESR